MDTGVQREKEHQRAAGIARRRALSVQQRTVFDAAIAARVLALPAFAAARTVLSYCAVGGEANPAAIDAAALRLGKAVAYPLCLEEGHMEAALPEAADALAPGRYGIPAPIPGRCRLLAPEDVDLALVPCAAFDAFLPPRRHGRWVLRPLSGPLRGFLRGAGLRSAACAAGGGAGTRCFAVCRGQRKRPVSEAVRD